MTFHESQPGKPSFCIFQPPLRLASDCGRTDNSEIQGLASPWDTILIPASTRCYTTTRRSNDPARSQPRRQITPRAQGRANFKIPTLKRPCSRNGDTNAASLTDGNMDTMHIIHIRGTHSPPPQVVTTHAAQQTQEHSHGPAGILRQNSTLARYHPFGEGYEQAR